LSGPPRGNVMRQRHAWVLGLGWCLAGGLAWAAADGGEADRWVRQLASPRFAEREAAGRELDRLGPTALPALRTALAGPDAEVAGRAERLIQAIELRAETADLLRPTRLNLAYQDTPLTEAVTDLFRRAGYPAEIIPQPRTPTPGRVT